MTNKYVAIWNILDFQNIFCFVFKADHNLHTYMMEEFLFKECPDNSGR